MKKTCYFVKNQKNSLIPEESYQKKIKELNDKINKGVSGEEEENIRNEIKELQENGRIIL